MVRLKKASRIRGVRGSVTLTWETAAVTIMVVGGFAGIKYFTEDADCAASDAAAWVKCADVLSCPKTKSACALDLEVGQPQNFDDISAHDAHSDSQTQTATGTDAGGVKGNGTGIPNLLP